MKLSRFSLLLLLMWMAGPLWATNLGVTPVAIHMGGGVMRTAVTVVNQGDRPATVQAETIVWQRIDGQDQYAETSEVMVNPALFTVEPGASQIVRVGLRQPNTAQVEATYRLVLREVPVVDEASETAGPALRVLVSMRLPIYVAPDKVERAQNWQVRTQGSTLQVSMRNDGNVHFKFGGIRARDAAQGAGSPVFAETAESGVVFPGETRNFTLQAVGGNAVSNRPVLLEVLTDRGSEHIPVTPDQGR